MDADSDYPARPFSDVFTMQKRLGKAVLLAPRYAFRLSWPSLPETWARFRDFENGVRPLTPLPRQRPLGAPNIVLRN